MASDKPIAMERRWDSGGHADSLPAPEGVDRYAIRRALDGERLADEAPDVPAARRSRIVKIRDEIRRGVYETPERLAIAMLRALDDAARPRRRA